MEDTAVLYHKEGDVGIITLNRPKRLNAINSDLLSGLIQQLHWAGEDNEVSSVVLTGAGRAFCAGEDLKETSAGKSLAQWTREVEALQETQRIIMRLGKPLIAAINGYAVGGGLEFALSCDIRIAGEDAKFGFPETGVGLTVTNAGTKLIAQIVGLGKAKELILTGDIIDAEEAMRIGLVNKVVPAERLIKETMQVCQKINQRSPLALKLSRIAIDQGLHSSFEQILELEASHMLTCVQAEEQKQFVEKKLKAMKKL
ncbi:MAG: enoyl-CoA hydratase/isomerase family protein [Desulfobacterales bacterium]